MSTRAGVEEYDLVVLAQQQVAQERIHPAGESIEHRGPRERREPIGEPLRPPRVLEPEEGVVEPSVAQPALVHLPGEPLMPVHVHLQREGEPRLEPHVREVGRALYLKRGNRPSPHQPSARRVYQPAALP